MKVKLLRRVQLLATPWTTAYHAPWSMGFSRQEYWSGVPLPSPIFCPTSFKREWAAFLGAWCPPPAFRNCSVEVTQHSNDLLMNLWGKKWSPRPVPLPSLEPFSNFIEEISSLCHFIVFLSFFALIMEEGCLISPCCSLKLCFQMGISFLFAFAFHFSLFLNYL